jgi:hypothetical protein
MLLQQCFCRVLLTIELLRKLQCLLACMGYESSQPSHILRVEPSLQQPIGTGWQMVEPMRRFASRGGRRGWRDSLQLCGHRLLQLLRCAVVFRQLRLDTFNKLLCFWQVPIPFV